MIEIVPTTIEHLDAILANPSRQMLADMEGAGHDAESWRRRFSGALEDALTVAEDGIPRGIMGWDKLPGVWYCWSATTPEYYDPRRPRMVLGTRRCLKQLAAANPGVSFLMAPVIPVTEKLKRWMGLLGYFYLADSNLFVYNNRAA